MKYRKYIPLFAVLVISVCISAACSQQSEQSTESSYTIDNIRDYVVGIDEQMDLESGGKKVVTNFDNAAHSALIHMSGGCTDLLKSRYAALSNAQI